MSLELGVELFNRGRYWEAHEAWEEAWTPDRRGPERGFYKGLIQVAAGCFHHARGNRRGAVNKWRGGIQHLLPYLPFHRGLDLRALVGGVEEILDSVAAGGWPDPGRMPRIERSPGP